MENILNKSQKHKCYNICYNIYASNFTLKKKNILDFQTFKTSWASQEVERLMQIYIPYINSCLNLLQNFNS